MAKGMYHYMKDAWRKKDIGRLRELMIDWRSEDTVVVTDKPTRIDKARRLGYKAKKGFVIARIRIKRGGKKRELTNKARKPKKHTIKKTIKMNYQWIAEQRVQKRFPNLEVLNSYKLAKDGKFYFFEVILVDYSRPEIKNDRTMNWICKKTNQNRVFRGLTCSARKSRGLRNKGNNLKVRPSLRAWDRKGR